MSTTRHTVPVIRLASHAVALARLPLDVAAVLAREAAGHLPGHLPGQRAAAPVAPEPILPDPAAPPVPEPVGPPIPGPGTPRPGPPRPGPPPLPDPDVPPGPEPTPEPSPVSASGETHEAFVTEASPTTPADAHGDGPTDPREVASRREMADEVIAADLGEPPVEDVFAGPDAGSSEPLLDAGTAKAIRSEAAQMSRAADPDA